MPGKLHTLPLKEAISWGALGMGRARQAVGSSAAPRLFSGQQEEGASPPQGSGDEQWHGSPPKEPEPQGVGSCPSALGLDAAFASEKGFKEFGLPGRKG